MVCAIVRVVNLMPAQSGMPCEVNGHTGFQLTMLLALLTVFNLIGPGTTTAGEFLQGPGPSSPDAGSVTCPKLPGCPGGPAMPLPPGVAPREKKLPVSVAGPTKNGKPVRISEGSGKYRGMVLVPEGATEIGSPKGSGRPDEHPAHRVTIGSFYISKHEVTTEEYCRFLNAAGLIRRGRIERVKLSMEECPIEKRNGRYYPKKDKAETPIVCVSWFGATDYARWAGARLPTEAEWERAAILTAAGPSTDSPAVLKRESTVPVTIATPGTHGVTGMSGNVWEWCSDWYAPDYYGESPAVNPAGPPLGDEKVIRGGSRSSTEGQKRPKNRFKAPPQGYFRTVGFRIVKDPEQ